MVDINFSNHFRDLFENTSDLIYFLKIDGEIELVNPAWLNSLKYESQNVIGKNIYDFIHPDYQDKYRRNRKDAIENNRVKSFEVGFVSSENELVIGEGQVSCSYILGEPRYTRCVFRNMTGKQRSEKMVRESEKRLKAFLTRGPDAVIVINEYQEILEWNPKAEEIFGYSQEEISGKTLTESIIPPQYREAHLKGMQHFLKTGNGPLLNKTVEITALHKSGKEFYINLSISNVKFDEGWLFIAFLSDISERKKTEEALIKKEAELMQSKILEAEKDQFISIASHELKTPITTVKAYTQLTLSMFDNLPDKLKNNLIKIDQYTDKLNVLLNELLDVSKINTDKLNLSKTEFDFQTFLSETLNSIQQISRHQIILEKNTAAIITADPIRLEQVITNLISNAEKYSPGADQIIVRSWKEQEQLICSVTDFGIGISIDNINKLFNKFYRVDQSTKFSGFGIGLYVSREIIKQHGGKIWVESFEEKGSTFYFSLPLKK